MAEDEKPSGRKSYVPKLRRNRPLGDNARSLVAGARAEERQRMPPGFSQQAGTSGSMMMGGTLTPTFSGAVVAPIGVKLPLGENLKKLVAQAIARRDPSLAGAEKEALLNRRYESLAGAMQEDPAFSGRAIAPGEAYVDVDQKHFAVSDEAGKYQWLGTRGVGPCGALILYAERTASAPATALLAHLDQQTDIDLSLIAMLENFDRSQTVKAVLVGKDTDLNLAGDIIEFLQEKNIPVKAHIGAHSSVAIHVASGSIAASPALPPLPEEQRMDTSVESSVYAGKAPVEISLDDRGGGKWVYRKGFIRDWKPRL